MRHETRSKLEDLERRDRRWKIWIVVSAVLLLSGYYFLFAAPHRSQRNVGAIVVLAVVESDTGTGQRIMHIEANIDTGKRVVAGGRPLDPPRVGERILLRERLSWTGYHSYYWEGLRP